MTFTDSEIQEIFREYVRRQNGEPANSLYYYARAIGVASRLDFYILRPASLILIAKYKLGTLLERRTA